MPGIVIFDSRGYVATPQVSGFGSTLLRLFDLSDPVTPTEIPQESPRTYAGTPTALVGAPQSALTGGPILALGTVRSQIPWGPSNLLLFDAASETPQWIGAVTVGTGPTDGILQQVVLKGDRAYVATSGVGKGIQVIDLATARDIMAAKLNGQYEWSPAFMDMLGALNTEGAGFGQAAIIQTVFVDTGMQQNSQLYALDVWNGLADGVSQPLVVATGRTPLAIVNPQSGQVLFNGPIPWPDHSPVTSWGTAIAVAHVADRDVAVLLTQALPTANLVVIDLANPLAPQVLSVLPLTGTDAGWKSGLLIKDGIAYIGGQTSTTLVNLTDPVQPRVAGTIAAVGGRLAIVEGRLLYRINHVVAGAGTAEGLRAAVLGSLAIVERVSPRLVRTDESGRTSEPIDVTYRVFAAPDDPPPGQIAILRDATSLFTLSLSAMTEGRHQVRFPSGLAFEPPGDSLEVRLVRADGSLGEPIVKTVEPSDPGQAPSGAIYPIVFDTLSPRFVNRGVGPTTVTITGEHLGAVRSVAVRTPAGWQWLDTLSRSDTTVVVQLPAAWLASEGFLQLSPTTDERESVAFLVADPALPTPGSTSAVSITSVDRNDVGPGGTLVVSGRGFTSGVRALLGRNGRIALKTEVVSDTQLVVELPDGFVGQASDLYLAIASSDGLSASAPTALVSHNVTLPTDYREITTEPVTLTDVVGTPVWNAGSQDLILEGVGVEPGVVVEVSAPTGRKARIVASPWGGSPSPDSQLHRAKVTVPASDLQWPRTCAVLTSANPSALATAGARCTGQIPPAAIPLGGRLRFPAYQTTDDPDRIYVLAMADPEARSPACPAKKRPDPPMGARVPGLTLRTVPVVYTYPGGVPTVPHPFSVDQVKLPDIPLVETEVNPCDPDDPNTPYLRGVRLPAARESLTIKAETLAGPGATVRHADLGPSRGAANLDGLINQVAGETGIPPQLLKGQMLKETEFDPLRYRYEPLTIDFQDISGNVSFARNDLAWKTIIDRHLYEGHVVEATNEAPECTVILGVGAKVPVGASACRAIPLAVGAPTPLADPGTVLIEARQSLPGSPNHKAGPPVTAERWTAAGEKKTVAVVDAPRWWRGDAAATKDGVVGSLEVPAGPPDEQIQIDYATNGAELGRPLAAGESIVVRYYTVRASQVPAGPCTASVSPTMFNEHDDRKRLTFVAGERIGDWVMRQVRAGRGGDVTTGTKAQEAMEFSIGFNRNVKEPKEALGLRTGLTDSRLRAATAQFVAAGSFGLFHATIEDWLHPGRQPLLKKVFDLESRCITDLMFGPDRERDSLRVVSARHAYSFVARTAAENDQEAWARRWARIIETYNSYDKQYRRGADGLNNVVREGIEKYGAK